MKRLILSIGIIIMSSLGVIPVVNQTTAYAGGECDGENTFLGVPPWYSGVCDPETGKPAITELPDDVILIGLNVISILLWIAGYVAVAMVIWGGIKYLTSAGDSSKVESGKKTIANALIGLLICLSAVAMINFVSDKI